MNIRMGKADVDREHLSPEFVSVIRSSHFAESFAQSILAIRENYFLIMSQVTAIEGQHNWGPDIVVFVNGLPLAFIELKNAADEEATI